MSERTITIETSDEEHAAAQEAVQPYCKMISDDPWLMSLLYDIDLMPEQVRLLVNARRLIGVCIVYKKWKGLP